jgi:hypothetical protein
LTGNQNIKEFLFMIKLGNIVVPVLIALNTIATYSIAQPSGEVYNPIPEDPSAVRARPGTVDVIPIERTKAARGAQAAALAMREQMLTQGWIEVLPDEARAVENFFSSDRGVGRLKPIEHTTARISFEPTSLKGSFLDDAKFLGSVTAGGFVDGKWTGLVRAFESEKYGEVLLEEYDYIDAGSHYMVPQEMVDSYVGGFPVLRSVLKSRGGERGMTDLSWFSERKHFRLRTSKAISKSDLRSKDLRLITEMLR